MLPRLTALLALALAFAAAALSLERRANGNRYRRDAPFSLADEVYSGLAQQSTFARRLPEKFERLAADRRRAAGNGRSSSRSERKMCARCDTRSGDVARDGVGLDDR